jgi:acetolactate synthase I/II/III large subunit
MIATYTHVDTENAALFRSVEISDSLSAEPIAGSEILIRSLLDLGVDTIFGYPGGVVLGIYDMLYKIPELRHILVRHEQGGTHAADGYSRATGKVGVVLATSGPGATNTVSGIATAFSDSIPMVILTGQVPTNMIGNDAFQEADIIGITRPITKHSFLVKDAASLPQVLADAFMIAKSGRPGPVVVDLPKDMLFSKTIYRKPVPRDSARRMTLPQFDNLACRIEEAADLISNARKPVLYVGGGVILGEAHEELRELAMKFDIPVTTTLMGLGAFPESHPLSLGMLGMHGTWYANTAVHECDVLVAVGARFDDRVTGRLSDFSPHSKKIHIDIDPACVNKNIVVDVPLVGNVKQVLPEITNRMRKSDYSAWNRYLESVKAAHPLKFDQNDGIIMPQRVIQQISEVTQGNAIITADVGQHQMWAAQYYQFNHPRSWINSGGLGTMGFGFPAALGAAIGCPDRTVVAIVGDGGFQMTPWELTTAVHYKIPVKIAILNNGYLGMVRQWQQLFYGRRYSHSHLEPSNPDFVKLAEAYGAVGMRATHPDEVKIVLEAAMMITDRPVVMDFVVKQEENVYPMIPAGMSYYDMVEADPQ